MIKDIYIIKNTINSKVYIGQSVNAKQRWAAHKSNAKLGNRWSAIDIAMNKYGIENFYYEIIETTEDYDNRETYWISYYDSVIPKGYNYCSGGDGSSTGTSSANAIIRNDEILQEIIKELFNHTLSQAQIADKYGIDKRIVSSINRGTAYKIEGIKYPIRKKSCDINVEEALLIQQELLKKELNLSDIALKYSFSINTIEDVNRGKIFHNDNYSYPLYRGKHQKLSEEQLKNLCKDLIEDKLSFGKLAEKYSVSTTTIRNINNGKNRKNELLSYPIRK